MSTAETPAASEKRLRTRARLLDAAAEVFLEVGVPAASVEAICERAGFTRGAFYSNFESKDELFTMLRDRAIEENLKNSERAAAEILANSQGKSLTPEWVGEVVKELLPLDRDSLSFALLCAEYRLLGMRSTDHAKQYVSVIEKQDRQLEGMLERLIKVAGLELRFPVEIVTRGISLIYDAACEQRLIELESGRTIDSASSVDTLAAFVYSMIAEPADSRS
ncbi:TetR family transcriptional regulator [Humidisolicoccus flavus]|uniref:TetR family transcriptional regulator n=1 Tax=Humidisolicoccus flavus TaxID=3111414 RepID=UPI00325303CC